MGVDPTGLIQRDEPIVVRHHAGPTPIELGVDSFWTPEQEQRLVDQVAAKVEQQPSGVLRRAALSPAAGPDCGPPALVARFESRHGTQRVVSNQALKSEHVAVPSTVVKNRQQQAPLARLAHELAAGCRRGGDRLVDDHRQSRLEGCECKR